MTPMYNPYSHLVYAACAQDVSHTIINGRVVMADRDLRTLDLESILAGARRRAEDVREWTDGKESD